MMQFAFNGKFLSQRMTGVQRYAYELITHVDKCFFPDGSFVLVVPPNAKDIPTLTKIPVRKVGIRHGVPWEQIDFPRYCKKNNLVPVNLCNAGPLFLPGIVCLHDVKIKRYPEFFTLAFRLWYAFLLGNETKRALLILTVSEFSRQEIMKFYHVDDRKVFVLPTSWQQFLAIRPSSDALERYHVTEKGYYFTLGSIEPNKNLEWIAKEAQVNPQELFLVSGTIDVKVFSSKKGLVFPSNVHFIGFAKDSDVKTLMHHAKALLFPSLYEGFGLPPLEALSEETPIIVSDIPVLHEIYESAATYVDPTKTDYQLNGIARYDAAKAEAVLRKYSWVQSADTFVKLTKAMQENQEEEKQ
jgi:glycosyltransferase involved in cell wall biosynthesis